MTLRWLPYAVILLLAFLFVYTLGAATGLWN